MTFPFTESGIKATLLIKALSQTLQAHMAAVGTNPCQIPSQAERLVCMTKHKYDMIYSRRI